jgi:hypothetical protein
VTDPPQAVSNAAALMAESRNFIEIISDLLFWFK